MDENSFKNILNKIKHWQPSNFTGPRIPGAQAQGPGWYPNQRRSPGYPAVPRPGQPWPTRPLGWEKLMSECGAAWRAGPGHSRTWDCGSQPSTNGWLHSLGLQPSPASPLCSLGWRCFLPLDGNSVSQLPARHGPPAAECSTLTPALLNVDLSHQDGAHSQLPDPHLLPCAGLHALSLMHPLCVLHSSMCGLISGLFHTRESFIH